jgi:large subunit ribosomal protein L6
MSRIGKQIIAIPNGTTVTLTDGLLKVVGGKGELSRVFKDDIGITIADNQITLLPKKMTIESNALWGTYASHIKNMIEGVTNGYKKDLILEGVGYKVSLTGNTLVMALGFSHEVRVEVPAGLTVTAEKNVVAISGIDKEAVGQFAAEIRSLKKPEPYKGKGFRYGTEVIRRKQGKKNV